MGVENKAPSDDSRVVPPKKAPEQADESSGGGGGDVDSNEKSGDAAPGDISIRTVPSAPMPTNSLIKFSARTLKNIVHGRLFGKSGWKGLNVHRKLDFVFLVLLCISYMVFATRALLVDSTW